MYIKELAVFGLSTIEMVHDLSFVQHGTVMPAQQPNPLRITLSPRRVR
jgi:hypothetical protein